MKKSIRITEPSAEMQTNVIRRIFREALEGSNTSQIARSLNDDGIPTPGQYFKSKHPDKKKFSNMSEKISWETVMVYNILKNLVYTGTLVSRKMKSCGVGSKKRVVNEPIIVEGTHEAIVSKEDFELAQKVIRGGGRNPTRKQHDYPLKGLVRCGNCKRAMTRRKNKAGIRYFQCIHSVNNGNTDCPIGRSFPEMDIEKVVFYALTQFLALAQKEAVQNREVGDLRKSAIKECAEKIRTLQKQNEQHKASKLRLYEKYAAGSITKEAYIQQKAATDTKIAENDEAIQRSHERMKELDSETSCSDEKLDAVCDQYADCKALTYELTHAFISAVYIYDLDNIEIVWKFKDFDLKILLKVLRSSTAFEELTPTLVNSLIRRIEVHNNDKSSGHCSVKVDIYFTAIGLIDIPTKDEIKSLMEKIQSNPQEYRLTA